MSKKKYKKIESRLHELSHIKAYIMRLRFGLQEEKIYSLREIGSMLNIPAKHIRDIELRDVNRLVSNQRLNAVKIDGN